MKDKVKFAVIGTSQMAENHIKAIKSIKDAELAAIKGSSKLRAEEFARKYGVKAYINYDELLKDKEIDVVDIVTINNTHADLGIKAALSGKHVIVEKPIDISLEKADKLIETCKNKKVKLSVISQHRFDSEIIKIKKAIDSGKLGKLFLGRVSIKWPRSQQYYDSSPWRKNKKQAGGGVLMNQAIHYIDILQWLMGPAKLVYGKVDTIAHDIEVEDFGVGIIKFENGAIGVIDGTTCVKSKKPDTIEIYGKKGSVTIKSGIVSKLRSLILMQNTLKDQISDFVHAIKENKKPLVDGDEGRKTLKIILAIYKSSKLGKEIILK